jgi:hypothetical protein
MGLILRNTTAIVIVSLRTVEGQLVRVEVLVLLAVLVVLMPHRHAPARRQVLPLRGVGGVHALHGPRPLHHRAAGSRPVPRPDVRPMGRRPARLGQRRLPLGLQPPRRRAVEVRVGAAGPADPAHAVAENGPQQELRRPTTIWVFWFLSIAPRATPGSRR